MGTRLRYLVQKTSGLKGKGRLTTAEIGKLTRYYGYAIRANANDKKKMKDAIWATYYHRSSTERHRKAKRHSMKMVLALQGNFTLYPKHRSPQAIEGHREKHGACGRFRNAGTDYSRKVDSRKVNQTTDNPFFDAVRGRKKCGAYAKKRLNHRRLASEANIRELQRKGDRILSRVNTVGQLKFANLSSQYARISVVTISWKGAWELTRRITTSLSTRRSGDSHLNPVSAKTYR